MIKLKKFLKKLYKNNKKLNYKKVYKNTNLLFINDF